MPRWLLVVVLVCGFVGQASADVVPQKKWLQVRSPHFSVIGDVSPGVLRQVAERMERLHAVVAAMAMADEAERQDITILVFKDTKSFEPFQPKYQGTRVSIGGYSLSGVMNYIAILAGRDLDISDMAYRTYVRLSVSKSLGDVPPWLGEGLAQFYSTFDLIDGGKVASLGLAPRRHVERLHREFLPLTTLTAVAPDSPYLNREDRRSLFDAASWALVHYLQVGKQRKYASQLKPFFNAILAKQSFADACAAHLGITSEALEQEIRLYLASPVLYHLNMRLPEAIERLARIEATPVSEAAAHATLADVLLRFDETDDARAQLGHALEVDAGQPLALSLMAYLSAAAGKTEEAAALTQRAGEASGHSYLSQYYRAMALERTSGRDPAQAASIEAAWREVLALNPTFADAHARLAQRMADTGKGLEQARQLQQRAIQLAPGTDEYLLGLARILIVQRQTKEARALLGPLAARSSKPEIAAAARRYLGNAAQVELAMTAATPPAATTSTAAEPDSVPLTSSGRSTAPERPEMAPAPAPPAAPGPDARRSADVNAERLLLRNVLDGEHRIFGDMTAIECSAESASVVVRTGTGTVRVRGGTLATMDFVSYRSDVDGGISCGPQPQALPVLVTYRPEPANGTVGELIIVEVVPPGYKPKAP